MFDTSNRPRIPAPIEPGVPQYYSTDTLSWGEASLYAPKGVLTPPVNRDVNPQRFKAFTQIFEGLFGGPSSREDIVRDARAVKGATAPNNQPRTTFYNYHIGDIFTPGTQNFVFEPTTELTPLTTIWGNAFLSRPNAFRLFQEPQQYADYRKFVNGIGGLIAGQYATQPLESIEG